MLEADPACHTLRATGQPKFKRVQPSLSAMLVVYITRELTKLIVSTVFKDYTEVVTGPGQGVMQMPLLLLFCGASMGLLPAAFNIEPTERQESV
ncbi:hypothetical protein AB9K35_23665 [Leisingera sp. XS_AS12]|uniref:hypothetical protein n=1 Tax=Leisingera sp. XS_AS12 TaxID=3241294 RepID=UPI003515BBCA